MAACGISLCEPTALIVCAHACALPSRLCPTGAAPERRLRWLAELRGTGHAWQRRFIYTKRRCLPCSNFAALPPNPAELSLAIVMLSQGIAAKRRLE